MMNIQQIVKTVRNSIIDWYDRVSGAAQERKMRYLRYGAVGVLILIVLVSLFFARRFFVSYREQNAQKALALCLTDIMSAQRATQPDWGMVEAQCAHAASDNSSSNLKPYFMALQAEALIKAGNTTQALVIMDTVIASMSTHDPLMPLFALKRALMQLDASQQEVQERGLVHLQNLAADTSNVCADAAQFYVGYYYWTRDQLDKAQEAWQKLEAQQYTQPGMRSPWADLARSKMVQPA
jgi:hypothetical protein